MDTYTYLFPIVSNPIGSRRTSESHFCNRYTFDTLNSSNKNRTNFSTCPRSKFIKIMANSPTESDLKKMLNDFRQNSDGMLTNFGTSWKSVIDSTLQNYASLQKTYTSAWEEGVKASRQANQDFLKQLNDNYVKLKAAFQTNFDKAIGDLTSSYQKNVGDFTKTMEENCKKHSLSTDTLKASMTELGNYHKKTVDGLRGQFKGIMEGVDKKYRTLVGELTIPNIPSPKLMEPKLMGTAAKVVSKAVTAAVSKATNKK